MILFNEKTKQHYINVKDTSELSKEVVTAKVISFDETSSIADEEKSLKESFDLALKDKKKQCFFHIFSKPTTLSKDTLLNYAICVCDIDKKPAVMPDNKEWWG